MNLENEPGGTLATGRPAGAGRSRTLSRSKKCAFTALSTLVFLLVLEGTLRLTGFRFAPRSPDVVINGQLVAPMFRHSRKTVWEPIPGARGFNRDGFIGSPIPIEKPVGTIRIAAVGDSCTQFGDPPYSQRLQDLLADRLAEPVEVLNAGVAGYSTEQGLRRLEHDVLKYEPDIVLIYFGWNDHWILDRFTDAQVAAEHDRTWAWLDHVGWSRIVHLGLSAAHFAHERKGWRLSQQPRVFRVPPERYRENLLKMIRFVQSHNARPILITAPTDMTENTPASDFTSLLFLEDTIYKSPKSVHDAYVRITREVARSRNVRLADAEEYFQSHSGLLTADHIHLTQAGIETIAELLGHAVAAELETGKNAHARSP